MKDIKLPVCVNGTIAKKFESVGITPVIFSHSYLNHGNAYSGTARDLASNGLLVITMDHQDGSCPYTEKKDGTPVEVNFS